MKLAELFLPKEEKKSVNMTVTTSLIVSSFPGLQLLGDFLQPILSEYVKSGICHNTEQSAIACI